MLVYFSWRPSDNKSFSSNIPGVFFALKLITIHLALLVSSSLFSFVWSWAKNVLAFSLSSSILLATLTLHSDMLACNTQTMHRGMFYCDQLIYCNRFKYSQLSPIIPAKSAKSTKHWYGMYFHISLLILQAALTSPNVPDQISDKLAVCAN